MLTGWKTYLGAGFIALGAVLDATCGIGATSAFCKYGNMLYGLGVALGIVGIRAKMERSSPG